MQIPATLPIFRFLSLSGILLVAGPLLAQKTINVPRDQSSIQAGIQAASPGDTVLVAPGRYLENIDFQGKAITVTSSGGAAKTILDGGGTGPTVTFVYAEPRAAVLSGFTIQNGGGYGTNTSSLGFAGVLVNSSAPTISNNIITQNQCWDIEILYGAPLVQGNTISYTQTPSGGCGLGSGAGIYIDGNLNGDTSPSDGSNAIITGNTIENITMPAAGNVPAGTSNLDAKNGGAGIAVFDGSPLIESNIIRNNSAPGGNGGAIHIAGGFGLAIVQNLIYGNSAGCGGGAISFTNFAGDDIGLLVANNTIVDNTGGFANSYASCGSASQIYADNYGLSAPNVIFVNNLVSGNTAAPAIGCPTISVPLSEANQPIFDHNLFSNTGGSVFGTNCVDVSAKYGNLSAAPQFANAAQGDYHLLATSPAIDAGNNSALGDLSDLIDATLPNDIEGNTRVQDATRSGIPVIDMGAYERAGAVDGSPTTIVLTPDSYVGTPGASLYLSAQIASPLGVPTGNVAFFLDDRQIGVSPINTYGAAGLSTVIPPAGSHSFYATYQGSGQGSGSGSFIAARSVIVIVTGTGTAAQTYTTQVRLGAVTNPQYYGQTETIAILAGSSDPNPAFTPSPLTLTLGDGQILASLTPVAAGIFRFSSTMLPVGGNTITATYAGDASHQPSTASIRVQILGVATSLTLHCAKTIQVGQTGLITADVATQNGAAPTGSIMLSDNGAAFADIPLVNGVATWNYLGRTTGEHVIDAVEAASGAYGGDSASCSNTIKPPPFGFIPPPPYILVTGLDSTSVLTVNPSTLLFESTTTLTATVSSANPPGLGTPTGAVKFFDGSTLLGTAQLANGVAILPTFALPFGASSVTCAYQGDSIYAPSGCNSVAVTTQLAQPTIVVTSSANPIPALAPVNFFILLTVNGHAPADGLVVQFSFNNQTIPVTLDHNGIGEFSVSNLLPGSYPAIASFAGNTGLASASGSLTETVYQNPSVTTLSASPNPAYPGQTITISALITALNTLVPTGGSVSFYDGTTLLGMGTVGQYRTATLTTSVLAVGVHSLSAAYAGDVGFSGSTSPVFAETVLPSSFTITLSPSNVTLLPQKSVSTAIQLASIGNFVGPLTLSYSSLPANASATLLPSVITLAAGGTGSSTLTIKTVAPTLSVDNQPPPRAGSSRFVRWPALMAMTLMLLLPGCRGKGRRWPYSRRHPLLWLALIAALLQTLSGCGGLIEYPIPRIAPGTYPIVVTATDANQHQQTATLSLVVPLQ